MEHVFFFVLPSSRIRRPMAKIRETIFSLSDGMERIVRLLNYYSPYRLVPSNIFAATAVWYAIPMNPFIRTVKAWLPLPFLATVLCGLVYVGVQQAYRQSANDPQIQMAEDAAAAVSGGTQAQSFVPAGTVDIGASLSPYVVFYDDAGNPTGGNGLLEGRYPSLPSGVFDYTRAMGEDRVTWQSPQGIRSAIVVVRTHDAGARQGFVMAGRSLREVERREAQIELFAFAAWITALVGTLILKTFARSGK